MRQKADAINSLRTAIQDEERRNSNLNRDLDNLNERYQRLVDQTREIESQIEAERTAQRNFSLHERNQRIQNNYENLRSTMMQYYNQIMGSLPLLMLLSSTSENPRLGQMIPVLLGTLGEFPNAEGVSKAINLDLSKSYGST